MKFINSLKTKIASKAEKIIKGIIEDIVEDIFIKYDVQLEDQRDYIVEVENQLNKINRDIVYIAEALKHTHLLLQKLEETGDFYSDDDDSSDKTYH